MASEYQGIAELESSDYKVLTPKLGKYVGREPFYWNPVDNGTYTGRGTNRIRFDIPNSNIWDFSTAWLSADVTLTSDGIPVDANPPYTRMSNGTWSMINRARHLSNMQPFEEVYPYNLIYGFQWIFEQEETVANSIGTDLLGLATKATRNLWGTTTTRFVFPLDLGWITSGPFPAKFINSTQSIELFLESPDICMESNCGKLNYALSNVELHGYKLIAKPRSSTGDQINPSERYGGDQNYNSWENSFKNFILSGQYEVMCDYWDWYQNVPVVIQGDYQIPVKTTAIQGIYTVLGNVQNISNPLVDDRLLTFPKLQASQYYLRIFSKLYPEQPIELRNNAEQAYMFYLNWISMWDITGFPGNDQTNPDSVSSVPLSLKEFNTTAFAMITDFRSTRSGANINPIFDTKRSNDDIRFYLRFESGASIPAGTCLYHFVRSSSIFGVGVDGIPYSRLN